MQLPWTLYADNHLGHWTLQTIQDVQRMEAAISELFTTLERYGLKVNPEKSHMIIQVKGSQLKKMVKSRTIMIKNQPHWKLQVGDKQHFIPLCENIYLGTKLSLKEGSDPTLEFRLSVANMRGQWCLKFDGHMLAKPRAWCHRKPSGSDPSA